MEVLLRKPPPAVAAPFLKRVQFLFEGEDSVQNYAKQDAFDARFVNFHFKPVLSSYKLSPLKPKKLHVQCELFVI